MPTDNSEKTTGNEQSNMTLKPDCDPNHTFIAVGRAITEWESLEVNLAHLYSIFIGKPKQLDALKDYGKEGRIFNTRMAVLEQSAEAYFRARPNQDHEGELDSIISETRSLAIKRHQIAHGVVTPVQSGNPDADPEDITTWTEWVYAVFPPWYAIHPLTNVSGYYIYGSSDIMRTTSRFIRCAGRAHKLANLLDEPV